MFYSFARSILLHIVTCYFHPLAPIGLDEESTVVAQENDGGIRWHLQALNLSCRPID